jgi:tight adherence protein C
MSPDLPLTLAAFGVASSAILILCVVIGISRDRVETRMGDIARRASRRSSSSNTSTTVGSAIPRMGEMLIPEDASKLQRLRARLHQAGMYQRHATTMYLGTKLTLMVLPTLVGLALAGLGLISLPLGVAYGVAIGLLGTILPTLWLKTLKSQRQRNIRRALPDALDVIVVCVEGGLSLSAALDRVASELRYAHPLLASEMAIIRRETQLGHSTGEALKMFSERFDAQELRSLASVISQAERFGASIVKALRIHAESLRLQRYQDAESRAQKAPVKLIFPTVLCIFPALYIVLMGPAGVQVMQMLEQISQR